MRSDSANPIEAFREHRGLTYDRLGALIGVSGITARRFALGIRPMDADMQQKLVAAAEGALSLDDLHRVRLAYLESRKISHEAGASA
jgi:hypothetical protein